MPEIKKVRAILEDELVDWQIIKKWEIFETPLADYLLNAYSNRRELVEEDQEETSTEEKKEEKKAEKKAEKKVSKKK